MPTARYFALRIDFAPSSTGRCARSSAAAPQPSGASFAPATTTCAPEFVELVAETLRACGYRVTVNDPYQGAECVRRHGAPGRAIHSLQIETNKKLFMDERTFARTQGFTRLRADLDGLLAAIAGFARRRAPGGE